MTENQAKALNTVTSQLDIVAAALARVAVDYVSEALRGAVERYNASRKPARARLVSGKKRQSRSRKAK